MKAKKTKSGKYKVVVSAGKDASGKYRQKAFLSKKAILQQRYS